MFFEKCENFLRIVLYYGKSQLYSYTPMFKQPVWQQSL